MIKQPKLFVVGGPNGAGKSTFALKFLAENPDYVFLNADEIARQLNPQNVYAARFDAGREFLAKLVALRSNKANLVVESTLSGVSLARQIQLFVDAGYYISLTYVFLASPEMSINRVASRVLMGGHYIPTADILRRVGRSKKNFWHIYRLLANEWQLVFNADSDFVYVAKFFQRNLTVLDTKIFQLFLREQETLS